MLRPQVSLHWQQLLLHSQDGGQPNALSVLHKRLNFCVSAAGLVFKEVTCLLGKEDLCLDLVLSGEGRRREARQVFLVVGVGLSIRCTLHSVSVWLFNGSSGSLLGKVANEIWHALVHFLVGEFTQAA